MLDQVRETGRPIVLTQRGRSAAVLVDLRVWQAMVDDLEAMRDVIRGEVELREGAGISHEAVEQESRARFRD